jgi:hypothetical protein
MMELMEPTTFILEPDSLILKHPDKWESNHELQNFLKATRNAALGDLRRVSLPALIKNLVH